MSATTVFESGRPEERGSAPSAIAGKCFDNPRNALIKIGDKSVKNGGARVDGYRGRKALMLL